MKKLLYTLLALLVAAACSKEEEAVVPPAAKQYTLTISAGIGGTVSAEGGRYNEGTTITVTATPQEEYIFTGWSDGNTDPTRTITIDANKTLKANFEKKKYPLTVIIEGEGEVLEKIVIAGRTTDYDSGTTIKLTAVPAEGWLFSNWSGAADSIESSITLTADAGKSITATFIKIPFETTIVGEGTVQTELLYNESNEATALKLTAVTPTGWRFDGWTGGVESSEMEVEVALDLAEEVTATFIKTYTLSVSTEGFGSVFLDNEELLTTKTFDVNSTILLTAVPETNWELQTWDGDIISVENPLTIVVDRDITLNAKFKIEGFAGGTGSESDPFQISNVTELQNLNLYLGANFILINDIDAIETNNWNDGNGFIPIGSGNLAFAGTLDGKEFSIKNLHITADNAGLFSKTRNAIIKNLSLENVNISGVNLAGALIGSSSENLEVTNINITGSITGKRVTGGLAGSLTSDRNYITTVSNINVSAYVSSQDSSAGGIVGYAYWYVKVLDSSFDGTVSGGKISGGIIGHARYGSEVSNSSVNGEIVSTLSSVSYFWAVGSDGTGGIIGFSELGIVKNSHSSADVKGFVNVGGLVGLFEESSWSNPVIYRSSSSGEVRGTINVGGLVGYNAGQIKESFSTGIVIGEESVGGLVGLNADDSFCCGVGVISNSYSLGAVSGIKYVGGLVGSNSPSGAVRLSFSAGAVSGNTSVGGLVGLQNSVVTSCYWDSDNSNSSTPYGESYNNDGATGLNTENITGGSASDNMSEFLWGEIWKTTSSYPKLIWE